MGLSARLIVGGMAAGAVLAYYVKKRHATTGEPYLDILAQLPSTTRRSIASVKRRATLALDEGKTAARAREAEFVHQLEAAASPMTSGFSTHPRS